MEQVNDMELLEQSKNLVQSVYEKMGEMESLGKLKDSVMIGTLGIVVEDGTLGLDLLSQDQIGKVKECITNLIDSNMDKLRRYLSRLNRLANGPATINQEFEQALLGKFNSTEKVSNIEQTDNTENKPVETSDCANVSEDVQNDAENIPLDQGNPESELPWHTPEAPKENCADDLNEEILRTLYLEQHVNVKEIASLYNTTANKVYVLLRQFGISRPSKNDIKEGKQDFSKKKRP